MPDRYLPFAEDIARFKLELERDGFAADGQITVDKTLARVDFIVENRTNNAHTTGVRLDIPVNTQFELRQDGKAVPLAQTGNPDYPWRAELKVSGPGTKVEVVRVR